MSALLVSALVKASDDELAGFLEKRQNLEIDEPQLKRVRDLVRELAHLLKSPDDERWGDVDAAYAAIVGGEIPAALASADRSEDEASGTEQGEVPVRAVHPSIDRPPALGELLGALDPPPASARSYPPSPWVEPSRAHENKRKSAVIPPPAEPLPPPMVVPPLAAALVHGRADTPESPIVDEVSQVGSTVIPPPMDSEPPLEVAPVHRAVSGFEAGPGFEAPTALDGRSGTDAPSGMDPPPPNDAPSLAMAAPSPVDGGPDSSQAGDTQPPLDQPPLDQPPLDQPPLDQPPFDQPPFDEEDEEETDRREPRTKTLPPVARNDEALPFQSGPPHPETPSVQDLPPEALASVITGLPPMTVVSYAALTASCDAMPARVGETHAKFGITDGAARQSLDAAWRAKLDEDPRLRALWSALHQQFRSWLTLLF